MDTLYGPYVINLDTRGDRFNQISQEFSRLKLKKFCRLPASSHSDAPLACIDSHCRALEDFLKAPSQSPAVMICEDDAQFKCSRATLDKHINEFLANPDAVVAALGYNSISQEPYPATPSFLRARDIQTRVCYIVKRDFAPILNKLWRRIYALREKDPTSKKASWYSKAYNKLPIQNIVPDNLRGDQAWKILQQDYVFLVPKKHLVIQRPSYSDIEKRDVDYKV
jgi:GR25 family glycosyltransferase involved in LPS biosynthesis